MLIHYQDIRDFFARLFTQRNEADTPPLNDLPLEVAAFPPQNTDLILNSVIQLFCEMWQANASTEFLGKQHRVLCCSIATSAQNGGEFFRYVGLFRWSKGLFRLALKFSRSKEDPELHKLIADIDSYLGDEESAIRRYQIALRYALKAQDEDFALLIRACLACSYAKQKEFEVALRELAIVEESGASFAELSYVKICASGLVRDIERAIGYADELLQNFLNETIAHAFWIERDPDLGPDVRGYILNELANFG